MKNIHQNLIAGAWTKNDVSIENRTLRILPISLVCSRRRIATIWTAPWRHAKIAVRAWRGVGLEQRQNILQSIGEELMKRSAELGELLSREEGKPLAEGKGEVYRAGQFFTYYAAETLRQLGENADSVRPGIEIDMRREPMGVVAVISPWNFPMATASWKIAPALAYGNAVIWKPANETPASAWALAEIIHRAGLPEGTFQLLMGTGKDIGHGLAGHRGIDAVTFTGSYEVGRQVAIAAAPNLTKYQLELGSKNALPGDGGCGSRTCGRCGRIRRLFRHRPEMHCKLPDNSA